MNANRADFIKVSNVWLVSYYDGDNRMIAQKEITATVEEITATLTEKKWQNIFKYSDTRIRAWFGEITAVRDAESVKALRSRFSKAFSQGRKPSGFEDVENVQQYDLKFHL